MRSSLTIIADFIYDLWRFYRQYREIHHIIHHSLENLKLKIIFAKKKSKLLHLLSSIVQIRLSMNFNRILSLRSLALRLWRRYDKFLHHHHLDSNYHRKKCIPIFFLIDLILFFLNELICENSSLFFLFDVSIWWWWWWWCWLVSIID